MLKGSTRRPRSGESGQALILALAFIAFFGLLVGAVLSFGGVTALQHVHTEATASREGLAEGGAAYAAADAARPDLPLSCVPGRTNGQLRMQTGDVASYAVQGCNPGDSNPGGGSPGHCVLCILNQTPIFPARTPVPTTYVLSATAGLSTTGGDDYINGSITDETQLTANPTSAAHIRVWQGATTSGCRCDPPQIRQYPTRFKDPLAGLPAPSPVPAMPTDCPPSNWNPNQGCSESFSKGTNTVNPGLWASLSVSNHAEVTASPGVYVFTGGLNVADHGQLTANSVTIYLACPNYGPNGDACPTSGTGGNINFSGHSTVSISAPGSPQYTNAGGAGGTLLGADVAILADPNLVDPGRVTSCIGGNGCVYSVTEQSRSVITGSIDTRGSGMSIEDNGRQSVNSGLLITNSLSVDVNGDNTGLDVNGPGTFRGPTPCWVFDDTVTGIPSAGGLLVGHGRAIVQSGCGEDGATNGIVAFDYSP